MNIDNEILVKCPFCGKEKELMQITSSNSACTELWSDCKRISFVPTLSLIQKCPHCGKYYFLNEQKIRCGYRKCTDLGTLSYNDAKEAYKQLSIECASNKRKEVSLRMFYIHTYNDMYYRNNAVALPTNKEFTSFGIIISDIIPLFNILGFDNDILKAELLREAKCFDESLDVLSEHLKFRTQKDEVLYFHMSKLCIKGDNKVFRF